MQNYFTEGSPYEQWTRIMEFALEYHIFLDDPDECQRRYNNDVNTMIDYLKNAFNDSSQFTKAAVIKALVLMKIFDNYDEVDLKNYLNSLDNDSYFINRIIDKAKTI